jgi:hypothetical protein
MPSDAQLSTDLVVSAGAIGHCDYFDAQPSEIKGMFLARARRGLGTAAHRGWARLLIGRIKQGLSR